MKKYIITIIFSFLIINTQLNAQVETPVSSAVVLPKEIQSGVTKIILGERDPFQKPKYIDDMELELESANPASTENIIDEKIESIRRWPLKDYKPIAVMWDVQSPKVMIVDRKGTMHLLKKNYRIGNRNGIITAINEGDIIVNENGLPQVIKIEKMANQ